MWASTSASQAWGFDIVKLGRLNERQHDRGALAAAIGAAEQQLALGRIVARADAAIVEEAQKTSMRLSI